ncbi:MAG: hypothetical protein MJZ11_08270 [Lachnospiraceae bacterium]|nr:hypothetical protein [Lachnospiraceae bacterium]
MTKQEVVEDLITETKMYFYNALLKDREDLMEKAWQNWCTIYMMYETPENATETQRIKDSQELAKAMAHFTDNEVYGITGYAKKKYSA